jgi:hypothetical protein
MRDHDVEAMVEAFRSGSASGTKPRFVAFDEIEAYPCDLSVGRYTARERAEAPSVAEALAAYKESSRAFLRGRGGSVRGDAQGGR